MGARTYLPLGVQPAGCYVAIGLSTMPSQDLGLLAPVLDCFLCLEPSLPPPSSLPPVTMRGISKGRSCQRVPMWKRTELTGQDWLHGIVRAPETSYAWSQPTRRFFHSDEPINSWFCRRQLHWGFQPLETKKGHNWDFSGSPVVRTSSFHCRGHGFNLWAGK